MAKGQYDRFMRLDHYVSALNDGSWIHNVTKALENIEAGKPAGGIFSPEVFNEGVLRALNGRSGTPEDLHIDLDEFGDLPGHGLGHRHVIHWATSSRRIYAPDRDLEILLSATSTRRLSIEDVVFPFPRFGLLLNDPIQGPDGRNFDFFLIGKHMTFHSGKEEDVCFLAITYIPTTSAEYRKVNPILRQRIVEAIRKRNVRRAQSLLTPIVKRYSFAGNLSTGETHLCRMKQSALPELYENEPGYSDFGRVIRVAIGLCKYLRMTHASGNADTAQPPVPAERIILPNKRSEFFGKFISNAADIWSVPSVVRLSGEERLALGDALRGCGREVRTHFREGFWRRPRGMGHIPGAEKTVLVRPTIVRRDRLPDNALPEGSAQRIVR